MENFQNDNVNTNIVTLFRKTQLTISLENIHHFEIHIAVKRRKIYYSINIQNRT